MAATGGTARIHIDAAPGDVYDLVTDVRRMGEWSPETYKAEWLGGATGPAVGARFKGSNRDGVLRWSTKPIVEVADRGREFTFVTAIAGKKVTRWRYRFTAADGGGCEVEESWEPVERLPIISSIFLSDKRAAQLQSGMEETLARLKAAAEA